MSKKIYLGVDGKARKVKKAYVGVDSKARKIKKGYVGVDGMARPFWTGGELTYYGNSNDGAIEPLLRARSYIAAASVGEYALFRYNSNFVPASGEMDGFTAYDSSLTKIEVPGNASAGRAASREAAVSFGDCALFGGGALTYPTCNTVRAFDKSLTRIGVSTLTKGRAVGGATIAGNYAIFAGGKYYVSNSDGTWSQPETNIVDAYDKSLTHTRLDNLSATYGTLSATWVGNYGIFSSGSFAITYDASLSCVSISPPTPSRGNAGTASLGNYALFAGGYRAKAVGAYDESLTYVPLQELENERYLFAGTTLEEYALFAGGEDNSSSLFATVESYDKSLTRTTVKSLVQERRGLAGATAGNYAIFAGGRNQNQYNYDLTTVDVYTI